VIHAVSSAGHGLFENPHGSTSFESVDGLVAHGVHILANVRLPEPKDEPSSFTQKVIRSKIASHVALNLRDPVGAIGAGLQLHSSFRPFAAVPEITVTKNYDACGTKHQIGSPRQIVRVGPVPKTATPQRPPEEDFWLRVTLPRATLRFRGCLGTRGEARKSRYVDFVLDVSHVNG